MNEELKASIDKVLELAKSQKIAILFLLGDGKKLHAVKNCIPLAQVQMMVNYIESKEEIRDAFTNCVSELVEKEAEKADKQAKENINNQ